MDKMEERKSYLRANYKRELYEALVKSYNIEKDLFDSYGDVFSLKRCRDKKDKDQDPSAGSDQGTKRMKSSKEAESSRDPKYKESKSSRASKGTSRSQHKSSGKSAHEEESSHTVDDTGVQQNQEFNTGYNDEQPANEAASKVDWYKKPERPLTPDPDWNKRQQVDFRHSQTWISKVARAEEPFASFDELMDTPFDFSAFFLNRLNITNLTQEILVGPTFNLLKGTYKRRTELEYHFEEFFKATTERLDWHNPEGMQYLCDLRKPLLLILDHRGRQVIPHDYFINNDLEYLKGGRLSKKYSTFVTKTKAATYEVKWIEDLVPNIWNPKKVVYDKYAYWVFHAGVPNVNDSTVTRLKIMKWYDYSHLDEIEVRTDDQQLYTFKESDFPRLRLQDIEDMLLLLVQQKLANLIIDEWSSLRKRTIYIAYSDPQGVIYVDENNINILMRTDELHKFSDGTLNDVRTTLQDISSGLRMDYLPKKKWSNLEKRRACVMIQDIDKQMFQRRLIRNLEKFVDGREYGEDLRLLERTL
ncbi:hypothetical protein Tco_0012006 [Tanacetum coccineum]